MDNNVIEGIYLPLLLMFIYTLNELYPIKFYTSRHPPHVNLIILILRPDAD